MSLRDRVDRLLVRYDDWLEFGRPRWLALICMHLTGLLLMLLVCLFVIPGLLPAIILCPIFGCG